MRIKLFFVDFKPAKADIMLRSQIIDAFQPFSREVITHENYLSFADMAESLDSAFTENDVVGIFPSLESYPTSKDTLMRALKLSTVHRFDIYLHAGDALAGCDFQSPEASVHTLLPVNSALFMPKGGLYPGFCAHSKNQYVMFLPFDSDITTGLLERVSGFLSEINGGREEEPPPESIHADICEIIANAGVQVAIARTPTADFICMQSAKITDLHRYLRLCPTETECEFFNPRDYISKQAILAAKMLRCSYGIAMSNIFTSDRSGQKELAIYYAVASSKSAKTEKITANEGESIDNFLARAVNALLDLLVNRLYDENPILQSL